MASLPRHDRLRPIRRRRAGLQGPPGRVRIRPRPDRPRTRGQANLRGSCVRESRPLTERLTCGIPSSTGGTPRRAHPLSPGSPLRCGEHLSLERHAPLPRVPARVRAGQVSPGWPKRRARDHGRAPLGPGGESVAIARPRRPRWPAGGRAGSLCHLSLRANRTATTYAARATGARCSTQVVAFLGSDDAFCPTSWRFSVRCRCGTPTQYGLRASLLAWHRATRRVGALDGRCAGLGNDPRTQSPLRRRRAPAGGAPRPHRSRSAAPIPPTPGTDSLSTDATMRLCAWPADQQREGKLFVAVRDVPSIRSTRLADIEVAPGMEQVRRHLMASALDIAGTMLPGERRQGRRPKNPRASQSLSAPETRSALVLSGSVLGCRSGAPG